MINATSIFGSVEIRVPENVSLRGSGAGILGNFEVDTLDAADPDAPRRAVDGYAVLGSVEAKPKRGKRDLRDLAATGCASTRRPTHGCASTPGR